MYVVRLTLLIRLIHVVHLADLVDLMKRRIVVHAALDSRRCSLRGCGMLFISTS